MKKTKSKSDSKVVRSDGLFSTLSNFGNSSRDSTVKSTFNIENLQQKELADYYDSSDLYARIVDVPPEEMLRAGFSITQESADDTGDFLDWSDNLNLLPKIEIGMKWARAFGGAAMILGLDDSLDNFSKAFTESQFSELKYVQVFDRFYMTYGGTIEKDLASKNFGNPYSYLFNGVPGVNLFRIHSDRIIRFEGSLVSQFNRPIFNYWSPSVLERLREPLMDLLSAYKAAAYLLQKTGIFSIQIQNLYQTLALNADGNGTGDAKLKDRLRAIELSMSVINGIVLGPDEKAERLMINFAGIPEMLQKAKERFGMAVNIPHTILFNQSPSGLGATGNSEMTHWNEYIRREQECRLKPILKQLVNLFYLERDGSIPKYSIKFNPLQIPTANEIADVQTKRVNNIRGLVTDQLISPEAGVESLVDDDDLYSLDIEVDDVGMMQALQSEDEKMPIKPDTKENA